MSQAIDYVRRLLYNFGWADAVELLLIGGIVVHGI